MPTAHTPVETPLPLPAGDTPVLCRPTESTLLCRRCVSDNAGSSVRALSLVCRRLSSQYEYRLLWLHPVSDDGRVDDGLLCGKCLPKLTCNRETRLNDGLYYARMEHTRTLRELTYLLVAVVELVNVRPRSKACGKSQDVIL